MSVFELRGTPAGPTGVAWALYQTLEQTQWLSAAEVEQGQLCQARTLLEHCARHVPYYQDLFRQASITPADVQSLADFRRLPILSRATYAQEFPRFQARALPPGQVKVYEDDTSGTSGIPVPVWQTNYARLWWHGCYLRDLAWCGIDTRRTKANIRVLPRGQSKPDALHGFRADAWNGELAALLRTGPLFVMDIRQDPRVQLDWLFAVQPEYLLSHTSNLEFLAELLLEGGRRFERLRGVQAISETLTPEARQRIEAVFGAPVFNVYSCTEAGFVASHCPGGHGLHVHAENVLLEVLDEQDRPCAPGETGRVVLTTLRNFLTPFIRYDIMDTATLGAGLCPCGRGLPLLREVQGKLRPLLRLPGARVMPSTGLLAALNPMDFCLQYQLVQRAEDLLVVRVVPRRGWGEQSAHEITRRVQAYLSFPIRVEIEIGERLTPTPGGKLPGVVVEC